METIFRQGMIVYDQVNYPNKKGVVVDVEPASDDDDYPIEVKFEDDYSSIAYTLDGRIELEQIPTLSTEPYKIILEGFKQEESMPTYDLVRAKSLKNGEYVTILNNIELPNERIGKAFEALAKLIWLRDYYNNSWKPNWKDDEWKYFIECYKDDLDIDRNCGGSRVLVFKTPEIRDKFLEEQRELLEIAKPLL